MIIPKITINNFSSFCFLAVVIKAVKIVAIEVAHLFVVLAVYVAACDLRFCLIFKLNFLISSLIYRLIYFIITYSSLPIQIQSRKFIPHVTK